jgi:hypothetical protein
MEENSLEYDDVKSAKISTMYEDYQDVERDESLLLSNKEFKKIHRVRNMAKKSVCHEYERYDPR